MTQNCLSIIRRFNDSAIDLNISLGMHFLYASRKPGENIWTLKQRNFHILHNVLSCNFSSQTTDRY